MGPGRLGIALPAWLLGPRHVLRQRAAMGQRPPASSGVNLGSAAHPAKSPLGVRAPIPLCQRAVAARPRPPATYQRSARVRNRRLSKWPPGVAATCPPRAKGPSKSAGPGSALHQKSHSDSGHPLRAPGRPGSPTPNPPHQRAIQVQTPVPPKGHPRLKGPSRVRLRLRLVEEPGAVRWLISTERICFAPS